MGLSATVFYQMRSSCQCTQVYKSCSATYGCQYSTRLLNMLLHQGAHATPLPGTYVFLVRTFGTYRYLWTPNKHACYSIPARAWNLQHNRLAAECVDIKTVLFHGSCAVPPARDMPQAASSAGIACMRRGGNMIGVRSRTELVSCAQPFCPPLIACWDTRNLGAL